MDSRRLQLFAIIALGALASCNNSTGVDDDPLAAGDGLVTIQSTRSFDETFNRLVSAIEANPALSIVAVVDHAAGAERVGMQLPPNRLILVGNPAQGTPLIQSDKITGIDLPQKFLVFQENDGRVLVTYNDPTYLARRHHIDGQDAALQQISTGLRNLAEGATR